MTVRKTVNPKQDLKNTLSEGEKGSAPPLCAAKRRKPLSEIKKHTLNEIKIKTDLKPGRQKNRPRLRSKSRINPEEGEQIWRKRIKSAS